MDTQSANRKIKTVTTVKRFDEYRKEIESASLEWSDYFKQIVQNMSDIAECNGQISMKEVYEYIAKQCDVSVDTVRKHWTKKFPDKRLNAIFLGLALHMDMEEINKMLKRYGKQPELYAKNISDSICIYMAQTKCYLSKMPVYKQYDELKKHILEMNNKKTFKEMLEEIFNLKNRDTHAVRRDLLEITDEDAFYKHITANMHEFKSANQKLYKYIEDYMKENDYTMNTVSKYEGLNPNYNTKYSHVKKLCECPSRNDLLALGIALKMTVEELNEMLGIAHMAPLYPKDRIEAAIIFVIFDIKRNFPDIFNDKFSDEGMTLNDHDIMTYLDYRKSRGTEYIDVADPEMMSYLKQAIYNIDTELWQDTKRFLNVIV